MPVKPMLAASATDEQIRDLFKQFRSMYASPKLDGIRCIIQDGVALSRSLKPIKNDYVQTTLTSNSLFDGLDGELIVGEPTDPHVYTNTTKGIMRKEGTPDFMFYVFDNVCPHHIYRDRLQSIQDATRIESFNPHMTNLEAVRISNLGELRTYEEACLSAGFEGVILRDPNASYKNGRATANQGQLIKVKRFSDSEAMIIGFEERMHNANEATTNELGRTQRSSHQENKVPMGTLGALICTDLDTGVQFNIGTGFSDQLRQDIWNEREKEMGRLVKYKSFKIGVKDAPRHPVFLGFRDPYDM
tara:strand:+ start:524 stop:1429 length:906 start_codon:yes stop_codon:yes gene_type:complete